jgi:hypothetical protein
MTLDELLALLPDNTTGEISAADLRAVVTSLYCGTQMSNFAGPFNALPASAAAFSSFPSPGPIIASFDVDVASPLLVTFAAWIDTVGNNNAVTLDIDVSGATTIPAGSKPWQQLRIGGKSEVSGTVSMTYIDQFNEGTHTFELQYQASAAGANVNNVFMGLVVVG